MDGSDRRSAAACPCPVARDSLYTPVRIVELDLDEPSGLRPPGAPAPSTRKAACWRWCGCTDTRWDW